jgi:hypothetical protein
MRSFDFDDMGLGETPLWKEKYRISWCHLCKTAVIACPACKNISCNGGGCDECSETFHEFATIKTGVGEYLTEEEYKIYDKSLRIQRFILETLAQGQKEINWKKLWEDGQMSQHDKELFSKELKG